MPLRYRPRITLEMCQDAMEVLWCFEDNLARSGMGGPAILRHERNAVGIPTRRAPRVDDSAFLTDADLPVFRQAASRAFRRLAAHLETGAIVIWPAEGIGSGRAELPTRAPRIWAALERARVRLEGIGA